MNCLVVGVAIASLLQGCVAGLPRLRPGSNVTLPQPAASRVVERLLGSCDPAAELPNARARDVVECTRTVGDRSGEHGARPVEAPTQR